MHYQLNSIIGQGTYGVVYHATHIQTGSICAIKRLYKKFKSLDECFRTSEIRFLTQYRHKNLVQLKDSFLENEEVHLVFEYLDQNLFQFYNHQRKQKRQLPEAFIAKIIQQILEGIEFIHERGYFHRDLKPENILISRDSVKICDFGQIKCKNSIPPFTEYTSTRWYRSPEQILKKGFYNYPVDIFALGAIMAELYTYKPLFQGKNQIDQLYQICNILGFQDKDLKEKLTNGDLDYLNQPTNPSINLQNLIPVTFQLQLACPEAIDLLTNIFQFDPSRRPTASELLKHEYFQKCSRLESIKQSKTTFRITAKNQKKSPQRYEDFTEEQKKMLSLSVEPKHNKQLILLKNYKEKPKKNIFQAEFAYNNNLPSTILDKNNYKNRIFNIRQKKKPVEKGVLFPKIMNKKHPSYNE